MATLEEIRRKKNRQAKLSYASSGLGLAGGALVGAGALIRKPKVGAKLAAGAGKARILRRPDLSTDKTRADFAQKVKEKGYGFGAGAGAIGGIGGLNFASIQRDESQLRRQSPPKKPVAKSDRTKNAVGGTAALGAAGAAAGYYDMTNPVRQYKNPKLEIARSNLSAKWAEGFKLDPRYRPYRQEFKDLSGKAKRARKPENKEKWRAQRDTLVERPDFARARANAGKLSATLKTGSRKAAAAGAIGLGTLGAAKIGSSVKNS